MHISPPARDWSALLLVARFVGLIVYKERAFNCRRCSVMGDRPLPESRLVLAATTHLVATATFSAASCSARGVRPIILLLRPRRMFRSFVAFLHTHTLSTSPSHLAPSLVSSCYHRWHKTDLPTHPVSSKHTYLHTDEAPVLRANSCGNTAGERGVLSMTVTTIVLDKISDRDREELEGGHYAELIASSSARVHDNGGGGRTPRLVDMASGGMWDGRGRRRRRGRSTLLGTTGLFAASMLLPYAAGDCIPLTGSTTCSAFQNAQISTSDALTSNYPFLRFVSNTSSFDAKFYEYTQEDYVTFKYGNLFGCDNLTSSLPDTSAYYARYTSTVLCSRMIQDSKTECGLSSSNSTPVCADTCAQFARSEQMIALNPDTCSNPDSDTIDLIRSDFTICSNPADSLGSSCIKGGENEPDNCGFRDNLLGLCLYCEDNSTDSIDTCCYSANAEGRCAGLTLPTFTNLPPITTATVTATSSSTPDSGSHDSGLSGGAIAGITIGSLAVVGALVFALLFLWRRKRYGGSQNAGVFNRPTLTPPSMTFTTVGPVHSGQGYEVLAGAGGRVARMSALESNTSEIDVSSSPAPQQHISRQIIGGTSSSSDFGLESSPGSRRRDRSPGTRALGPAPRTRNTSLSSSSIFMSNPTSPGGMTSSDISNQTSEQLPYFKDYYSSEDIHPGDKVACLWAYAPRASDEFELERGDMLKVIGIWDDGWATGIFLPERADDISQRRSMRDSGVSARTRRRPSSAAADGEIKAFPLVCVCLPDHWQKTIENEANLSPAQEYDSFADQSDQTEAGSTSGGRRAVVGEKSSSRFKDDLNVPRSSTPHLYHSSSKVGLSFLDP